MKILYIDSFLLARVCITLRVTLQCFERDNAYFRLVSTIIGALPAIPRGHQPQV
jgi:hypothetical protein